MVLKRVVNHAVANYYRDGRFSTLTSRVPFELLVTV
jgi:hypothetical protein